MVTFCFPTLSQNYCEGPGCHHRLTELGVQTVLFYLFNNFIIMVHTDTCHFCQANLFLLNKVQFSYFIFCMYKHSCDLIAAVEQHLSHMQYNLNIFNKRTGSGQWLCAELS